VLPTELPRATLLAQVYAPDEAARAGYLDRVVPAAQVHESAREEAIRLSAYSRGAYSATKTRLRGRTIEHIRATLESDLSSLLMPTG
jgi:enoyl-CoA hydratase/carnithine racemase